MDDVNADIRAKPSLAWRLRWWWHGLRGKSHYGVVFARVTPDEGSSYLKAECAAEGCFYAFPVSARDEAVIEAAIAPYRRNPW